MKPLRERCFGWFIISSPIRTYRKNFICTLNRCCMASQLPQSTLRRYVSFFKLLWINFETNYITQLHYLTNVIKENMRLSPPVPLLFSRVAATDIAVDGMNIPAGVRTYLCIEPQIIDCESDQNWCEPSYYTPWSFILARTGCVQSRPIRQTLQSICILAILIEISSLVRTLIDSISFDSASPFFL